MADKVKPLKIESTASGGSQDDVFPTEANPAQDYLATKGIALENSDTRLIDLSASGEIQWIDSIQTTYKKLNDIRNFSYHKIDINVTVVIFPSQHMITTGVELDGFLDLQGGLVLL